VLSDHRDVNFIKINESEFIVTSCDSCGAIGLKKNDVVKVPYNVTGKYTARVCLMEILSIGAKPIGLTVNICNEPSPTGEEILRGIKDELKEIDYNIPITISTEKNMQTSMTALGVTAIGIVNKNDLIVNKISAGDYIYVAGIPSVGNEVIKNRKIISSTKTVIKTLGLKNIKEIIPVGSTGIRGELNKLMNSGNLKISLIENAKIDINKSAGPSTCIIIISNGRIKDKFDIPLNLLGRIIK